jgi:integrase
MMATRTLTPRGLAALRTDAAQLEVWDDIVPGLAVRVGRGGTKAFVVRYRHGGRHRRLTLGKFPRMSLADARTAARKALQRAQEGEDPAEDRRRSRSDDRTFGALATEVLRVKAGKLRPSTLRQYRQVLDAELLPVWKNRQVSSITRRDVVLLLERIGARAPVQSNRTLAVIRAVFNTGLKRGFPGLAANPAHMLEAPHEEQGRDRYLDRPELRTLWRALEWEAPLWRAVFRLALLTGARMGNVCALRWADIDGADVWRIPAAQFKGKREHWVPLSAQALAVLAEMRKLTGEDEYAFPGRNGAAQDHVTNYNGALLRIRDRAKLDDWNPHDFRTTARTWMTRARKPAHKSDPAGCGIAPHVADAVLGHAESSLGFRRYTGDAPTYMLSEKRAALEAWGKFVAAAVKGGAR